jgi:hypothetical protein
MNDRVFTILSSLGENIPLYLAYAVGIAIAIALWRRAPRASLLTMIALSVLFAANVGFHILLELAPDGMFGEELEDDSRLLIVAWNMVDAIAIGLLVVAVFQGRKRSMPDDDSFETDAGSLRKW